MLNIVLGNTYLLDPKLFFMYHFKYSNLIYTYDE